ncbi:MAG: glutamate 5-kinase [Chloroflexota bacterium]|nr:glutamate 5-kinase [Chloroflexota bacterium]
MADTNGAGTLRPLAGARRVVVKLGTALLTGAVDQLDLPTMQDLVGQVVALRERGVEVVVVTSGAVAAGRQALEERDSAPDALPAPRERTPLLRQVLAAVGQSRLMHVYEQLFGARGVIVAQALLTRGDVDDEIRRKNTQNTLEELLKLGVVPVVNENDVVANDELEGVIIGDNDTLSGMVARMLSADLLIILGEVAGLYSADPNVHPDVELIPEVLDLEALAADVSGPLSPTARGGMVTKIQAAREITAAGIDVIIADGHQPDVLARLLAGEPLGTWFSAQRAEEATPFDQAQDRLRQAQGERLV